MRCPRTRLLPLLLILSSLPAAAPAAAQNQVQGFDEAQAAAALPLLAIDRQVDWCSSQSPSCTIHAIKDFSGDGIADVLTYDNSNLRIFTGPFKEANEAPEPRANFRLVPTGDPAAIHFVTDDVNGDKSADISILNVTADFSGFYRVRIAIVYGMRSGRWPVKGAVKNLGSGDRGDAVLTYTVDAGAETGRGRVTVGSPPTFALQFGDVNGDKLSDLVLSMAEASTASSLRRDVATALVKFGNPWGWQTSYLQPDLVIDGYGACAAARSLVQAVADLDGDGVADLVTRSCPRPAAPPRLSFMPGRASWPSTMYVEEAVDGIHILPPGDPPPPPPPPPTPDPNFVPPYYAAPAAAGPTGNIEASAQPLIDLNGDGRLDFAVPSPDGNTTSVFYGGPTIGAKLAAGRVDKVIANGGLGHALRIGAWKLAGSGSGTADELIMQGRLANVTTINVYSGAARHKRLLDGRRDRSPQRWSASGVTILAVADVTGDGAEDLVWRYSEIWDGHFLITEGPLGR